MSSTPPTGPEPQTGESQTDATTSRPPMRTATKVWLSVGITALVIALVVGAVLFQPWRIWSTTEVNETLPTSSTVEPSVTAEATAAPDEAATPEPEPQPIDLATGEFITHEHETTGSVRIVEQPDGSRVLAIENLATSDGPDLKVWLSDQPVIEGPDGWGVFDDGAYLDLGSLKGNVGNQLYEIPADADLSQYSSVSIWCARFAVSFGAAELIPAP